MKLNEVNQDVVGYKPTKRLGRGLGTGQGKTAGRGHKGEYQHNGKISLVFQGGTMPLYRRLPKRGFNNFKFAFQVGEVNLRDIEDNFENGDEVNRETLRKKGLAKYRYDILKVLGTGELTKKVKIVAHRFSATARKKLEAAGVEIVELPLPQPVVKNKMTKKSKEKK
ncbi:MAG: 50S ribosomal protein L15 [Pirellulaceae bacterium]|jgi:large subunit ribosomal protein L15|nr:50S ribosomal protein L15 [Pirellulaceae bacterium]